MGYFPVSPLKIVLTSAQILSLNSAPVGLIPGRAGCIVEISSVYYRYLYNSTAFNPGDSDAIALVFGSVSAGNVTVNQIVASGFVDQTADQSAWNLVGWSSLLANTPTFPLSSYVGQGVSITQYNMDDSFPTGANWTQGDGKLAVFISYSYLEI